MWQVKRYDTIMETSADTELLLLLLFIKPPTAGHHQLKGLKNIFRAIFFIFIYKLQYEIMMAEGWKLEAGGS